MRFSDRELLVLAAGLAEVHEGFINEYGGGKPFCWNPLLDDGDAFRLSVKLNFEIERSKQADRAYAGPVDEAPWVEYVTDDQDIYACTRRAIVCAAAELAKATA